MANNAVFSVPCARVTARRGLGYGLNTSLPKPTVTAHGSGLAVNAEVPAPEVVATGLVGVIGQGDIRLPHASISATGWQQGVGEVTVPAPTVQAKAALKIVIEVPAAQVTAAGETSVRGSLAATVPCPSVEAKSGISVRIEVPLPAVTASGLVGTVGQGKIVLPAPDVVASADNPLYGQASITVPVARVSARSLIETRGTASITVPVVQVAPHAFVGVLASASITVPCVEVEGSGYYDVRGTASIVLPLVEVFGNSPAVLVIISGDGTSESVVGFALVATLENSALTEYSNFEFNSFAKFNGLYLGASSTGIHSLTGDRDNTARIVARFRTALGDADSSLLKGVEDLFIGLSSDGVLEAIIVTDGDRSYQGKAIPARETEEMVTQRVKLGKGMKSRYYAVEIQNRAGADFDIDAMEMPLIPHRRQL